MDVCTGGGLIALRPRLTQGNALHALTKGESKNGNKDGSSGGGGGGSSPWQIFDVARGVYVSSSLSLFN